MPGIFLMKNGENEKNAKTASKTAVRMVALSKRTPILSIPWFLVSAPDQSGTKPTNFDLTAKNKANPGIRLNPSPTRCSMESGRIYLAKSQANGRFYAARKNQTIIRGNKAKISINMDVIS